MNGLLYLTSHFRKLLNKQFILGIASASSSGTIRLSGDTQHKMYNKCNLLESFVGGDAVFINLLKKLVLLLHVCYLKYFLQ